MREDELGGFIKVGHEETKWRSATVVDSTTLKTKPLTFWEKIILSWRLVKEVWL